ncbi:rho GTPase-activating protein 7-like [Diabrotica virgifera virgifera]|uniref:Rho GTPase-activating protein 7-like n=2 Tax=Diabrotica virgifera virgifera TaxID=50390 RepID=A0ABM5JH09_DIAVI|nr:rho GTPase-activating protein 7-like [Diabrotica virgifera virgifera]
MEKYCPGNWDLSKLFKKNKPPHYNDKNIFGAPLAIIFRRTGKFLPVQIEEAMLWLEEKASDEVGIFRTSGVNSRIQELKDKIEANQRIKYRDQHYNDVTSMFKLYFKEIPGKLLTSKLSETFILIFQYIPKHLRMESVICALLLLPEEHSQVFQALLYFLLNIASKSEQNQMTELNLTLCWAPSLFDFSSIVQKSQEEARGSSDSKELAENKAAQECLLFCLQYFHKLFKIPRRFINQCTSREMKEIKPKLFTDIGDDKEGWREYLIECHSNLIKESKGWKEISPLCKNSKISIFYKKASDGLPLRFWKVSAELDAPPSEVKNRILRERHIWDPDLLAAKIIKQLGSQTEIFQYIRKSVIPIPTLILGLNDPNSESQIRPIPNEEYCVIRTWKSDLSTDSCTIVETSVEYPERLKVPNTFHSIVLASKYIIEPYGSGKSKIIHFSRVDIMGRSPGWYHKNYGYLCGFFIENLQTSFHQNANG